MKRIFVLFYFLSIFSAYGQNNDLRISGEFNEATVEEVLVSFYNDYGIQLAYDNELVRSYSITVRFNQNTIEECLIKLFQGTDLTYSVEDEVILIFQKPVIPRVRFDLSGQVTDAATGETLPNALIKIEGLNKGTVTNVDGRFSLFNIASDTLNLIVDYLGYQLITIPLSNVESPLNIELNEDARVLDAVTITDNYELPLNTSEGVSKIAFNAKELSALPSLGEQDLFRGLQYLPGVSATNESSSGLTIRGSIPGQNLILLDGFTLYHLDHFFGVFSALNPDVIKDVQLYKSAYHSRFGGRVSGVVDITAKTGSSEPKIQFGANLVSMRTTAQIPIGKKANVLFSARRAYTDVIQSSLYKNLFNIARENDDQINRPIDNEVFQQIAPDFYFYDINFKASYRPSDKDILAFSVYSGKDNLFGGTQNTLNPPGTDFFYSENLDENNNWGNNGVSLKWGRQWNDNFYSNLRITGAEFYRNYSFDYNYILDTAAVPISNAFEFSQQNTIEDGNFMLDNTYTWNDRVALDFGIQTNEFTIDYTTTANDEVADEQRDRSTIISLYSTGRFTLGSLNLSIGFRSNYHELNDTTYFEPRINLAYQLSDNLKLKAGYGIYHQFINQVLYDHPYNGSQNFWALSNREGIPEVKSSHYVLGLHFKKNNWLIDLEGYYKDLSGVVEFNLVPRFTSDEFVNFGFLTNGQGRMRGIDLLIQKEYKKYRGWVSYSLSRSLQSFPTVERGTFFPSLQDQLHEINFINMLTLGKWDLSTSFIYGSGTPFPEFDILYLTDDNGIVEDVVLSKDRKNQNRLPAYHRMDIAAAYNFKSKKIEGQFGLSIFNVYGQQNIKTRKVNISNIQRTLGTTDTPNTTYRDLILIGFTPSLFMNITF